MNKQEMSLEGVLWVLLLYRMTDEAKMEFAKKHALTTADFVPLPR